MGTSVHALPPDRGIAHAYYKGYGGTAGFDTGV